MKSILIAAAVVVVALVALAIFDPLTRARWVVVIGALWVPALLLIGFAAASFVAFAVTQNFGSKKTGAVASGVLLLAGVVAAVGFLAVRSWNTQTYYADLAADASAEELSFQPRVPHAVAAASATASQAGATGDAVGTKHLPATGTYTTLIERKGGLGPGYVAAISQQFDAAGKPVDQVRSESGIQGCEFNEKAHHRIGGLFANSLERLVTGYSSALRVDDGDVWAYCAQDGIPKVVVPVTRMEGVMDRHHVPAGVVVYDGATGDSEWKREVAAGELPGPTVGIAYSQRVNEAMDHRDRESFLSVLFNRTGYTDELKDAADDPNAVVTTDEDGEQTVELNSSLALADAQGHPVYASPMTRVASSTSIEYVQVLDASTVTDGQAPAIGFHKLDPARESNAVLADKVADTYPNLEEWKLEGTRVQEIAPGPDGDWIASIGRDRSTFYRVSVHPDGSMDLADVSGPQGGANGFGQDDGEQGPSDPALPNVDELTPEQLVQLGRMIDEELASRISNSA